MIHYSEFRFYSPVWDCESARISVPDEQGREFFSIIRADDSKKYRASRDTALESLVSAIVSGREPGQVFMQ